jgi:cysteinyl-tRNA synthetase
MAYDVLRRVLESRGLSVLHIQNVTDVEDKIINRAREVGEDPLALARRFSDEALDDTRALNILPAHQYPRVSDNMIPILELIRGLEERGYAYARGGDVYFDVSKDEDYGKLSGQKPEDLESGARIEAGELKDDPLDFALWKGAKAGEPSWESPYGGGRPGWHIECSAMALNILGPGFDIHGGARELVFPHHENEVAQSESYLDGGSFAKIWWHCGELRVEGRKMSKSLGNFLTVRDALKLADANVWRLLFLMTHPRSPLDYSSKKLQEAQTAWNRLENALLEQTGANEYSTPAAQGFRDKFEAALSDDLNTPEALAAVFDAVGEWNRAGDTQLAGAVRAALEMLGFTFQAQDIGDALTPRLLEVLINVRNDARERRDWKASDSIRDQLKNLGVVLEDTPEGTKWKIERGATV